MMWRRYAALPVLTITGAMFAPVCLLAQTAPSKAAPPASNAASNPPSNNFTTLFPNPTGENGYEYFVQAGDILKNSRAWQAYQQGLADDKAPPSGATLAKKRELLSDPEIMHALAIFRIGLRKPAQSPHVALDDATVWPEYGSLRDIARLLMVEIYVRLADGRISEAIDSYSDGLRLGYRIQTDALISGLVGVAIDSIVVRAMFDGLEQLSTSDCEHLLALANERLKSPDPSQRVFARERETILNILRKYRDRPESFLKFAIPEEENTIEGGDTADPDKAAIRTALQQGPDTARHLLDETLTEVNARFDYETNALSLPYWQRQPYKPAHPDSIALKISEAMIPILDNVAEKYVRDSAQVQILGVHAAIRRFRWDNNRLPTSLAELNLGRLAQDPLTGQPFAYKQLARRNYELSGESINPDGRAKIKPAPDSGN